MIHASPYSEEAQVLHKALHGAMTRTSEPGAVEVAPSRAFGQAGTGRKRS